MFILKPKGDHPPVRVALDCDECQTPFVLEAEDIIQASPGCRVQMDGRAGSRVVKTPCPSCDSMLTFSEAEWDRIRERGGTDEAKALLAQIEAEANKEGEGV